METDALIAELESRIAALQAKIDAYRATIKHLRDDGRSAGQVGSGGDVADDEATLLDNMLAFLEERDKPVRLNVIAEKMGVSQGSASTTLRRGVKAGRVARIGRGLYATPAAARKFKNLANLVAGANAARKKAEEDPEE